MKREEDKPDIGFINRLWDEGKSYYNRMNKEVMKDVELYNQEYIIDVPEGFHQIRTPTTKTMCDRAADRIGQGRWQMHMEPRNGSDAERTRVEKKEKAAVVLPYLMRRRVKYNPIRGMALHAFNRGAFVPKVLVDTYSLSKAPTRTEYSTDNSFERAKKLWAFRTVAEFPVILDVRPIESVILDPETDGDHWIIEHYRRKVGDVKKNYPWWDGWNTFYSDKLKKSGGRFSPKYPDNMMVTYTEYWSREWRAVTVDGQFISIGKFPAGPVPNVFGRVPYFARFSGFGDPAGEPHMRCVSILRAIRDTSRSMTRLFSIIDTVAENDAYSAAILKKGDTGNATFEIGPGAKNEMDFPEMVKPYHAPGVNPTLLSALSMMSGVNEQGSVPSEAIGQAPQANRNPLSGVSAAILTGQASMILDPVKSAIEDAMSDIVPFVFYTFDTVVEEELPVYGQVGDSSFVQLSLTPKDIDGHYGPVMAKLLMREPEDDYAKYQLGIQAMSSGFPPEFVFEKFFGIENTHEFVKNMMAKQIAYSPQVREQYLIPRLIEQLKAKAENRAPVAPGERVAAPATFDPAAAAAQLQAALGGANPDGTPAVAPPVPADARARAEMGMAMSGPAVQNGPPAVNTAP